MQPDTAITTIKDDKLGRSPFAEILAKALLLPYGSDGLVVALEGEWGTGKTVILNFVEEIIKELNKDALVVRFDPWLISGLDTLCQGFFVQLAAALEKIPSSEITNRAANRVLNLAKFLSPIKLIPGVEPWGTIVETVISSVGNSAMAAANIAELDLIKRKNDLEDSIKELNMPIVVIIDDIDRLNLEEVRTVFRLVKAVGNFKRVSYLLAYDPVSIYKALETDGITTGKKYLEKIVQVSYPVPKLRFIQKKRYLHEMVKAFISAMT
jgi:predicted KAP-like P-loop ATPase